MENNNNQSQLGGFQSFGVQPEIIKSLDEQGIVSPTDIQREVIPIALRDGDVVAQAPTGTGKTLAFALPMLAKIDRDASCVQALVLCPTRELVIQICEVIQNACKYYERVRVAGLYGGQNIQRQLFCLRKKPQIVVGTPGRLLDHIDRRTLKLGDVSYLVLDECDEMLDMGFRGDIEKIDDKVGEAQRLCFSATIPQSINTLIQKLLHNPTFVKTSVDGEDTPKIEQYYCVVKDAQRLGAMLKIIDKNKYDFVIAFCNTKTRADKLFGALKSKGREVALLHGDLRQSERTQILKRFKAKELKILVATDVASRGLDIDGVQAIINFDPPTDEDFYVHRIGRTARASKEGVAYTLIDSAQVGYIPSYQRKVDNALKYMDIGVISDSFTMPKDCSNKLKDFHDNQSRFFLNVGKRDLLDKDSLTKLLLTYTPLKIYEIADLKIRDTYSFVSVIKGCEGKLFKLKGVVLGKREVTIQDAKEEEKPQKQNSPEHKKNDRKSAKGKAGKNADAKREYNGKGKNDKTNKPSNNKNNSNKKSGNTQSKKSRLTQMFEDELNYSMKKFGSKKG
ncbi:MAG: DEAD/DEAH box helicase [Clostridia bacterium]|nr:DEAD/DEAH box helicase [Clostridia bacterium]